jgi:hypothetical protein
LVGGGGGPGFFEVLGGEEGERGGVEGIEMDDLGVCGGTRICDNLESDVVTVVALTAPLMLPGVGDFEGETTISGGSGG